jgi:hypothetical protein
MNKKIAVIVFVLMLSACFSAFLYAETIYLKSGRTAEGKIIERTEDTVKLDVYGTKVTYYLEDIDKIDNEKIASASDEKEVSGGKYYKEEALLNFDGRDWKIGYQASNVQQSIIEYVLEGEVVENWSELATVQTMFNLPKASPNEFMEDLKVAMKARCPDVVWNVLNKSDNDILYEWIITTCSATYSQHEIARIITGEHNLYIIHYVTKTTPTSPEVRQKWIDLLKSVTLVKVPLTE